MLLYAVGWVRKYVILQDGQMVPNSLGAEKNKHSLTRADASKPFAVHGSK